MAAPLLLRGLPLHRLHHHRQPQHHLLTSGLLNRRLWCNDASESIKSDADAASSVSLSQTTAVLSAKGPPPYLRRFSADYRKWKAKESEILRDIEPVILLTKEILHSDRYMDGELLTAEDVKIVVEKLLAYHPRFEDKIGCGLDSIMVDRHPQFKNSRCLFVVRKDGIWIDFSYQKCLRQYIRDKYPLHAERFIKEHFKLGS
nr:protein DCL, chloroplastic-like [Ipomoea trifida]GMD99415.1 protein DCL, chloroplastic [Ipomoea batatas]